MTMKPDDVAATKAAVENAAAREDNADAMARRGEDEASPTREGGSEAESEAHPS